MPSAGLSHSVWKHSDRLEEKMFWNKYKQDADCIPVALGNIMIIGDGSSFSVKAWSPNWKPFVNLFMTVCCRHSPWPGKISKIYIL